VWRLNFVWKHSRLVRGNVSSVRKKMTFFIVGIKSPGPRSAATVTVF